MPNSLEKVLVEDPEFNKRFRAGVAHVLNLAEVQLLHDVAIIERKKPDVTADMEDIETALVSAAQLAGRFIMLESLKELFGLTETERSDTVI
jgi:hypothetical protein